MNNSSLISLLRYPKRNKFLFQQTHFIRCIKPNSEQKPIFFDEKFVLEQLKTSGTMAYNELMKVGFPSNIGMDELLKYIGPSLESRHTSLGLNNCCLILLLANGFQSRDFVFGKTEIHFRPGKEQMLEKLCYEMKQPDISNTIIKFKKGFVAFMRRVLIIRFIFLKEREFISSNIIL